LQIRVTIPFNKAYETSFLAEGSAIK
jgi:hypothetical protein